MELLSKLDDVDCWIRSSMKRKDSFQWSWTICNFNQILSFDYVESFPFKLNKDSQAWWLKLYPKGIDADCKDYISIQLFCSNSSDVFSEFRISLVNSEGDLVNAVIGSLGQQENIKKFIERKMFLNDDNLLLNGTITIHCTISEYGERFANMWERSTFDEHTSQLESVTLLIQDISTLSQDKRFSDGSLKGHSTSEVFHVHKDLLASRSSFFKTMLWNDTIDGIQPLELPQFCPHETCDLVGEVETIKQILKYIYSGSIEGLSHHTLRDMCYAAESLNLKLLRTMCLNVLMKDLNLELNNLMEFLQFAHKHNNHSYQQRIYPLLCFCRDKIIEREDSKVNLNAKPKFGLNLIKLLVDSCSLNNEDKNQLPTNKHSEMIVSKKSFAWSILHCSTFMTKTLVSPYFSVAIKDIYNCNIRCEFFQDSSLYIRLQPLVNKCCGHVQFQFSIIDNKGNRHYSSPMHQENLIKEKYHEHALFKICSFGDLKQPAITPNDVLTVHCDITVCHTQEKSRGYEFPLAFIQDMRSLYEVAKERGDLTLLCDGQELRVHKYIICARSNFFDAMFRQDMEESRSNVFDIAEADVTSLKAMLLYVYVGVVDDLSEESATGLLKLADRYDVHGLKDLCSKYLISRVSILNVLDLLALADVHSGESLRSTACEFIEFHSYDILGTSQGEDF